MSAAPRPPVLFEEIPPLAGDADELAAHLDRIERILADARLDGIALPEIQAERRADKEVISGRTRVDTLEYAAALRRRFGVPAVPYRVVARTDRDRQANMDWLARCRDAGVTDVVLVGGQASVAAYPCSVHEMNHAATRELGLRVGNILIPSRRDEVGRVRTKLRSGATFFTTQVLFEPAETVALLRALAAEPLPAPTPPVAPPAATAPARPTLYLCFSPLSRPQHLEFAAAIGCTLTPAFRARADAALAKGRRLDRVCVKAIEETWSAVTAELAAHPGPCDVGLLIGDLGRKSSHAAAEALLREYAPRRPAELGHTP